MKSLHNIRDVARLTMNRAIAIPHPNRLFIIGVLFCTSVLSACMNFSDVAKIIIAKNEIVVIMPENKSSIPVEFQQACVPYICLKLRDKPFDLDYSFEHDVAASLASLIASRGNKQGPRYYLEVKGGVQQITMYLLDTTVSWYAAVELRDEAGNVIEKSNCFDRKHYPSNSTDIWREHPDVMKNELGILAKQCVSTFRKELNL